MNSGIYEIICLVTRKKYIGSSSNLKRRKYVHFDNLKNNKHINNYLQNSFNKYGVKAFRFKVLVFCSSEHLLFLEQKFLDYYTSFAPNDGFNIYKTAGSPLGFIMSKEQKLKLSKAHIGKKFSEMHRYNIRDSNKGKKRSKEFSLKMSKIHKGKTMSIESRLKISKAAKGRKHTKETKQKLSKLNKGDKHYLFGKSPSILIKNRMSLSARKRGISKETRIKMILTRKRNHILKQNDKEIKNGS